MRHTDFSLSTVLLVVLMVAHGVASFNTLASVSYLAQEIAGSLLVNQRAILKNMNEASSCASTERELREMQLWKEEAKQQMQAMEDNLRNVTQDVRARKALEETMEARQQSLETVEALQQPAAEGMEQWQQALERVEGKLQNILHAFRRIDPMLAPHNDTEPSLCDETGKEKVLHGARGSVLTPTPLNIDCYWRVVLPNGTRPVFHWEIIEGDCDSCRCDGTTVSEVRGGEERRIGKICREESADPHQLDGANTNEFIIHSWGSRYRRSIRVYYEAVHNI